VFGAGGSLASAYYGAVGSPPPVADLQSYLSLLTCNAAAMAAAAAAAAAGGGGGGGGSSQLVPGGSPSFPSPSSAGSCTPGAPAAHGRQPASPPHPFDFSKLSSPFHHHHHHQVAPASSLLADLHKGMSCRRESVVHTFYTYFITIRYDTRCHFNVRSKADTSQLNLPHAHTHAPV